MKKSVSLFLALVLMFSLTACSKTGGLNTYDGSSTGSSKTAFAEKRVFATDGQAEKRTLDNTLSRLKNDKKLTVAYFGGSVTAGQGGTKGGWRAITTQWFKDSYPDAEITEIDASIGGAGSLLGISRVDEDIIAKSPDLVFIEFAINDVYEEFSKENSAVFVESIVRRINSKLPDTDIVFVFVTDKFKVGTEYTNLVGQREVAEFYGIPYIDAGAAINNEVAAGHGIWENYFVDSVHASDKGYEVYGKAITEFLSDLLSAANPVLSPHKMPEKNYTGRIYNDVEGILGSQVSFDQTQWKLSNTKGWLQIMSKSDKAVRSNAPNATLTIEFEGVALGMVCELKNDVAVTFTVDGTNTKIIGNKKADCDEIIVFDNLTDGKHTVTLTCSENGYISIGKFIVGK